MISLLSYVVAALDDAGVPFMLAGSFASSMHGAPRATRDIDLIIDPTPDSLEDLLERLANEDFYLDSAVARREFRRRGQFNVIDPSAAWKADLIYRKARAFSRVEFERRTPVTLLGTPLFVATAEDTFWPSSSRWERLPERGPSGREPLFHRPSAPPTSNGQSWARDSSS